MMRDDVGWAIETNHIDCLEETWDEIVRVDPFACAYATYGDPHWDDLKCIFGDPMKPNATTIKNESEREVIMISSDVPEPIGKCAPLNEVIEISSDKSGSLPTDFWNELGYVGNLSDEEGSFRSPSLKTEMSSSNPPVDLKGKGKRFGDNICMNLYGASYISSSTHASPNAKK